MIMIWLGRGHAALMTLACLVLGLLAGGMLVIGVAFVSFWKSLSPSDFGLSDSAVRSLLDRSATWHWIRTGFGMVGFIAALRALQRS